MRKISLSAVIMLAFAGLLPGLLSAGEIPWDKIIGADAAKLTASQKSDATRNLNSIRNTRGCKGTLAACMAKGDITARRHGGFVVRMTRKAKTDAMIKQGVADRAASAFPEETFKPNLTAHPREGAADAKIVLVEYACFECPFCAHLAPKLKQLKKRYKGKLAHYYKFFPVRSHKHGVAAALAGLAAQKQGKFWKMHDLLYANRTSLKDADIKKYAKETGLDVGKFQADLTDKSLMKMIEKDKLEGMRFGVEGTPTFLINGKIYLGMPDFAEIEDRIAEELDIVEGRI